MSTTSLPTAGKSRRSQPTLPEPIRQARPARLTRSVVKPGLKLEEIEKEAIRLALGQTKRNRAEAAEILGISVRTLQRKIKEYEL